VNLGPVVNSTSNDGPSYLSSDGRMLFVTSDRPGGFGNLDLYITTRTKGNGH
jgi:Tol biopolymer transport system component